MLQEAAASGLLKVRSWAPRAEGRYMEFSASVRGPLSETLWFCRRLCVEVGKTHRAWGQVWLLVSVDHHLLLWVQPLLRKLLSSCILSSGDLSRGAHGLGLGCVISKMPAALGWGARERGRYWMGLLSHTMAI